MSVHRHSRISTLLYSPLGGTQGGRHHHQEPRKNEITCTAEVIRLERNAAHPQAALHLIDNLREWKKKYGDGGAAPRIKSPRNSTIGDDDQGTIQESENDLLTAPAYCRIR